MPILRQANVPPTPQTSVSDESLFLPRRFARFGATRARNAVARFVHGNTQEDRKEEIADRLPIAPREEFFEYLKTFPNSTVTWKSVVAQLTPDSSQVTELHEAIILYKLDYLLYLLDDAAQQNLADVSYLEPLRATAQRYYRREEISTDELDPKGLNTPFFIQGLTSKERESLASWTQKNFGFLLSIRSSGGHVSLNIQSEQGGGPSRNMADVGLGYSQIVPVALQLWAARNRRSSEVTRRVTYPRRAVQERQVRTVVVEQPELHLHPAYQAKLADVFAGSIRPAQGRDSEDSPIRIIAETHSSTLIARIGELITDGVLAADAVQILVFEDSETRSDGTAVRVATFNEEGELTNWPIGFFDV